MKQSLCVSLSVNLPAVPIDENSQIWKCMAWVKLFGNSLHITQAVLNPTMHRRIEPNKEEEEGLSQS